MEHTEVAERYARALIRDAGESADEIVENLSAVVSVLRDNEKLKVFFESPRVDRRIKHNVLKEALQNRVIDRVMNLVLLLIDKKREQILEPVSEFLSALNQRRKGVVPATITLARDLKSDSAEYKAIEEKVTESIKNHKDAFGLPEDRDPVIQIKARSNPDIVGGIIIRIDDYLWDASVKRYLSNWQRKVRSHKMTNEQGWIN